MAENSSASSPGRRLAYYGFDFEGYHFPGERPWSERWSTLRALGDFRGRRCLELGCNLGLLSSHLLMEAGAGYACGVDKEADILDAARLVADALHVKTTFERVDFDLDENWEERLLVHEADVVFALNVFNWISDKPRFLKFLSNFKWLIYEGHDPFPVEWSRLREVGFVNIELVATTERGRPLMVCRES